MKTYEISPKILSNLGIESLNQMQIDANQYIQDEKELLLLAPTGSGKTLAFLLPIFNLLNNNIKGIQCLVLTPSRELALQIEQVWKKMATGFKVNTCYGGHSVSIEIQNLSEPPALLIGTPGRVFDHLTRHTIDFTNTKILILDEFDKSLSMGFEEDMSYIIERLPVLEKRILVSATSQLTIPEFVGITRPKRLDFTRTEEKTTDALILKTVISDSKDKTNALFQLLCFLGAESTLIFCNLRETAEQVANSLQKRGLDAAFFHGKLEQIDREKTLVNFRNGSTTFLVASDLAARGLDIPDIKNIIHFELPLNSVDFTHRNGRTARMNAGGTAYILMSKDEKRPSFISPFPKEVKITENCKLPETSKWITIYISGGKKDKISKMDIVGFLAKVGNLVKNEIGLIEVMDFMSFVAVSKTKVEKLIIKIKNEKMKGKKYKIEIAR